MKKFLITSAIAVLVIVILGSVAMVFIKKNTKSFSPEEGVTFSQHDATIKVQYNRPYKKGREIFGGLVPYDSVWRTGANEATVFETSKDILIDGKKLRAGKYTLWTIPGEETWTIIFNSETGQWGVNFDGEANRNPDKDVLQVKVRSVKQEREFEQFTISFEETGEEAEMVLIWDKTLVAVPIAF
jgi:hypothetical protein